MMKTEATTSYRYSHTICTTVLIHEYEHGPRTKFRDNGTHLCRATLPVALFVVTLTTGITYNSINAFINHAAVFVCTERIDQVISNYERKWWLVG